MRKLSIIDPGKKRLAFIKADMPSRALAGYVWIKSSGRRVDKFPGTTVPEAITAFQKLFPDAIKGKDFIVKAEHGKKKDVYLYIISIRLLRRLR